jgi:hypothetical protein
MNELLILGGSAVLLVWVVVVALWLDARDAKRQHKRDKKGRPLIDFGRGK